MGPVPPKGIAAGSVIEHDTDALFPCGATDSTTQNDAPTRAASWTLVAGSVAQRRAPSDSKISISKNEHSGGHYQTGVRALVAEPAEAPSPTSLVTAPYCPPSVMFRSSARAPASMASIE